MPPLNGKQYGKNQKPSVVETKPLPKNPETKEEDSDKNKKKVKKCFRKTRQRASH